MTRPSPIGVLVMAYGTASGPGDIERYYTDIRGGRAPSPLFLKELKDRYAAIGNVFPLLETTRAQAEGVIERLNAPSASSADAAEAPLFHSYLGMKHSPPFIADGIEQMRSDGVERAIGIVMAPHWSAMSVESYIERAREATASHGDVPAITFVRSYSSHPAFVDFLSTRVKDALETLDPGARAGVSVIFSAHSLPLRTVEDGSSRCRSCDECRNSCRYVDGLQETADLVAARLDLGDYTVGWQSAGRTADPWWGPTVEEMIRELAAHGRTAVVVCSAGFVADHLETLFDLDIEAKQVAEEAGVAFVRTRMPNADPEFLDVLAAVVRDHLASVAVEANVP